MNKNIALITAGIIFTLISLLHLVRLLGKFEVTFAGHSIPMWASVIGFIVTLILAIWMFITSRS